MSNPLDVQVGGQHYKDMKIQPVEFIAANSIGFLAGNAIKYICRHKSKGGAEDVRKAIHYLELILQLEYNSTHAWKDPVPAGTATESFQQVANAIKSLDTGGYANGPPERR